MRFVCVHEGRKNVRMDELLRAHTHHSEKVKRLGVTRKSGETGAITQSVQLGYGINSISPDKRSENSCYQTIVVEDMYKVPSYYPCLRPDISETSPAKRCSTNDVSIST